MLKLLLLLTFLLGLTIPSITHVWSAKNSSSEEDDSDTDNTDKDNSDDEEEKKPVKKESSGKKSKGGGLSKMGGAAGLGAMGMAGGGKNASGQLIQFLMTFPAQMDQYTMMITDMNCAISQARVSASDPMANPQALGQIYVSLCQSIMQLQTSVVNFRMMPFTISLKTFSQMCVSPTMTAAMAMPGAGQVVAGLCAKIAAFDMKLDVLLGRAEALVSSGLAAKEILTMRLTTMPGGQETLMQLPPMPPLPVAPPPQMMMGGGMMAPGMMGAGMGAPMAGSPAGMLGGAMLGAALAGSSAGMMSGGMMGAGTPGAQTGMMGAGMMGAGTTTSPAGMLGSMMGGTPGATASMATGMATGVTPGAPSNTGMFGSMTGFFNRTPTTNAPTTATK